MSFMDIPLLKDATMTNMTMEATTSSMKFANSILGRSMHPNVGCPVVASSRTLAMAKFSCTILLWSNTTSTVESATGWYYYVVSSGSRLCLWPTIFVWSLLSTPHFPGAQYHQIVTGATVKLTPSDKKKLGKRQIDTNITQKEIFFLSIYIFSLHICDHFSLPE